MLRRNLPLVAQESDVGCAAACFESMLRYFGICSPGEMQISHDLGTFDLGYTDPAKIVDLAQQFNLEASLLVKAQVSHLKDAMTQGSVVFVTWWDEDAGHYSLVKDLEENHITLMDPWLARYGISNRLVLDYFLENWNRRGSKILIVDRKLNNTLPIT
jgi:predicted double-glycine peptidase